MNKYLSFGGGVNSTALMLILLDEGVDFETVHVNHGGDSPETYDYVDYLRKMGYKITSIKPSVKGFDDIYEFMFHERIIPFIKYRSCSQKFKSTPLEKHFQKPCVTYIGYDFGEKKRVKKGRDKKGITYKYPLIDGGITRAHCIKIIKDHNLKIPPKSGCWFCPFQSKKDWIKLMVNHPDLFKKAITLEENTKSKTLTLIPNGPHLSTYLKISKLEEFFIE